MGLGSFKKNFIFAHKKWDKTYDISWKIRKHYKKKENDKYGRRTPWILNKINGLLW